MVELRLDYHVAVRIDEAILSSNRYIGKPL